MKQKQTRLIATVIAATLLLMGLDAPNLLPKVARRHHRRCGCTS